MKLLAGLVLTAVVGATAIVAPNARAVADVSVLDFGANATDALDDSAAIQAANDHVAALGGGRVSFPAGTYLARGIQQDSGVEFAGAGQGLTTIKLFRPTDPPPDIPMIEGRRFTRSGPTDIRGSVVEGSRRLTVSDASNVVVGSVIAVRGAGGAAADQATRLTLPLSARATVMTVASSYGFGTIADHRYLLVGDELIAYSRADGNRMFYGLYRGRNGTRAAYHPIGTPVAQARTLIAEVASVEGNIVTLDRPAVTGVLGSSVEIGSVRMTIRDMTLDGDHRPDGRWATNPWPLYYAMARWVNVVDTTIRNGDNGGLALDVGTRDSRVERSTFRDNGDEVRLGSAHVWLYRNAVRNVVDGNVMSGPMRHGVIVDDRTETSTGYDGPATGNQITNNVIDIYEDGTVGERYAPIAIGVFGSWMDAPDGTINNVISGNELSFDAPDGVERGGVGIVLGLFHQGSDPVSSNLSHVTSNTFRNLSVGIRTNGVANTFADNSLVSITLPCEEYGGARYNIFLNNIVQPQGSCSP